MWLTVAQLWLVSRLPLALQYRIGTALGALMYVTMPRRRRIARINLRLCFPELGPAARRKLLRRHFASLGLMAIEIGLSWWAPRERLRKLARVEGIEHLDAARAQGKGVILLNAHFTTLEMGGHLLPALSGNLVHAVYRPHENAVIEYLMTHRRDSAAERLIPRDDVRTMIRSLRDNAILWYAPDQAYINRGSVMVPFFGHPAATNTGTARLAKLTGAAVVPYVAMREPGTLNYRLVISPALQDFPGDDPEQDAARLNAVIEEQVRTAPADYYWVHRRFKRRGENPYGERRR